MTLTADQVPPAPAPTDTAPAREPPTWVGLAALAGATDQLSLKRGDVLVRQGEPSDTLYFVLSGRFTVQLDGDDAPITEIGQGRSIGEIGFFAGLPRTATVVAKRDSRVLAITRERFRAIGEASPEIRDAVILSLASRVSESNRHAVPAPAPVRTLIVMPAGASGPSPRFLDGLRRVFATASRAVFLTPDVIAEKFPGRALDDAGVSNWLNGLESDADFVVYLADDTLTDWTRKCIRQADAILLVGEMRAAAALNPSERFALSIHPRSARRLVLLHEARTQVASGTAAWLEPRDVFMHHHVALQDTADIARLFRFIAGRAVGFVAGGGGALGSAHLGVYKAFCEAGADFDILGGTSVGAAMMAAFACGADAERVDQGTRNIFVTSRAFRRLTLPRYGLIDHKVFDRALRAEYGDTTIEDLWRPFFAVSSNLSEHKPQIHRSGPVWQAVRASGAIPGVLPPFFTRNGDMLVDGAVMDNVPLAPMRALKSGPNVIAILGPDNAMRYPVDYDAIPGPIELAALMLNPFSRRRLPQAPNVLQVIMLSMAANRPSDLRLSKTDVAIWPEIPGDCRFTNWDRHNEIFLHAHRGAAAWIEARLSEQDAGVLAVVGRA
jgi:NTE family protein